MTAVFPIPKVSHWNLRRPGFAVGKDALCVCDVQQDGVAEFEASYQEPIAMPLPIVGSLRWEFKGCCDHMTSRLEESRERVELPRHDDPTTSCNGVCGAHTLPSIQHA
jgi:hypothetical protein